MQISIVNLLLSSARNEFRVYGDHDHGDDRDDGDDVTRPVYLATFPVINGGFINDS